MMMCNEFVTWDIATENGFGSNMVQRRFNMSTTGSIMPTTLTLFEKVNALAAEARPD